MKPDWDLLKAPQESLREHMHRIRELEAEVALFRHYGDVVAELCPEDLFNQIDGEFNRRTAPKGGEE